MSERIRVVIADDMAGYRTTLERVLASATDIQVVGIARDGNEAVEVCEREDADVLLTDIEMPRMDGIAAITALAKRKRDISFVVLTVHEDNDNVFDAIRAGAMGYLLKTSTPDEVISAIRRAAQGEATLTPKIATMVLNDFRRQREDVELDETHLYELSARELEILDLVTQGMRNKEIADRLCLAEKTVKNHVSNILKALQVNSRTEAAMKAIKEKLVSG
ncbi:MAG: Transcriptional regulatory protein LiaR [Fimbriimonadales bacterium]|nr:Transcriptional regulatory protein LiaR [Fimbriimonadales bacterium]